jgi:hypothetical protein
MTVDASEILASFTRIARVNGGALSLLSQDGNHYRFIYDGGVDESCDSGACVLPHLELQQMMREWLQRRDPAAVLTVIPQ